MTNICLLIITPLRPYVRWRYLILSAENDAVDAHTHTHIYSETSICLMISAIRVIDRFVRVGRALITIKQTAKALRDLRPPFTRDEYREVLDSFRGHCATQQVFAPDNCLTALIDRFWPIDRTRSVIFVLNDRTFRLWTSTNYAAGITYPAREIDVNEPRNARDIYK